MLFQYRLERVHLVKINKIKILKKHVDIEK